jgi:DNA-binding SARP family transcriptional activator
MTGGGAGPPEAAGALCHLLALGRIEIIGADGAPLNDLAGQTKLVALLVYLVIAQPRGFHRRDRLLGLLWPELDDSRARGALRKAVHLLRRALGDQILESRGDEDVRTVPTSVRCDAVEFDTAIDAGQTARALELYRGDLLPSFFVRDAGDFEQWLEETRAQYRKRAATAAWILAERSEEAERATIAADWARQAVTLAPLDERVIRKTLALLGRVGDRAGAVALYESFRQQLLREYGVEPAPETAMLIKQIRAR